MPSSKMGNAIECCTIRDRDCETALASNPTPRCRSARSARSASGNAENFPAHTKDAAGQLRASSSKSVADRALADKTNTHTDALPSQGSLQHDAGQCKRCCFFPRNRCTNGYDCEFCHYEHEKRSHRKRKSKGSRNRLGLEVDVDDNSEEDRSKFRGLEIQIDQRPLSPDSLEGDPCSPNFADTPEPVLPVFVQSCLCTVPVDTRDNTTAVPVYKPTLWGDEQKSAARSGGGVCTQQQGVYLAADGARYQIPRDWAFHPQAPSHESCFLPESGSIILPETAPLTMHEWVDMPPDIRMSEPHWQEQGCAWPLLQAEWQCSQSSDQQAWEWSMHGQTEESYFSSWNACQLEESRGPASMCWNAQQAEAHMQEYMPTDGDGQENSHMPEYMPAVQCLPAGLLREIETPPFTQRACFEAGARTLPPGVEIYVDAAPPLLAPGSPKIAFFVDSSTSP